MLETIISFLEEHKLSHEKVRESDTHVQLDCPLCTDSRKRLGIKIEKDRDTKYDHHWKCFNCFPSYSAVLMEDGSTKEIKDIRVGDKVITGSGQVKPVTHVHNNGLRSGLIHIQASYSNTLECTPEHEIAIIRKENVIYGRQAYAKNKGESKFGKIEYVRASSVREGDWLVSPKIKRETISEIDLNLKRYKIGFGSRSNTHNEIEDIQVLDYDLGFLMGLYAAEGSYNRGLFFSLNSSETHIAKEIERIAREKFGLTAKFYDESHRSVLMVYLGHSWLGKWFNENLGHTAINKRAPDFILTAPLDFKYGFLKGLYKGDGTKKSKTITRIGTISRNLGVQTKILAQELGLFSGVKRIESKQENRKPVYSNYTLKNKNGNRSVGAVELKDVFAYRVKKITTSTYTGEVFDLTVADEHTYTVNGLSVHNCGAKGKKLSTLRKAMGDLKSLKRKTFVEFHNEEKSSIPQGLAEKCHELIFKEDKEFALKYLMEERGLSEETIKHFKIGFRSKFKSKDGRTYDAGPHISLPGFENGKCVYLKYRSIDPNVDKKKKWRREVGCKTVLFNDEAISDHEFDEIFIAEAEIDCMSIWNAGFRNVVGLTAGADTFESIQEWYDKLERFKKVYLVMDNDEAGQAGAKKIARRLGLGRVYNIELPADVKDPNDYFKKYTSKDFNYLKEKAKQFNPDDVVTLHQIQKEFLHELISDTVKSEGYTTGFPSVDKVLGPLREGNLVVIAARPKVGKCLTSDSIIINPETMMPTTLEEAIKAKQRYIHSYNEKTKKLEVKEITDWIDSGVKPIVRVETKIGRAIKTTYSHRYLTFTGWKYVSDLKIGEKIAVPTRFDFFGNNVMSDSELFLLGALVADGGLSQPSYVGYTKADPELIAKMRDALKTQFDGSIKPTTSTPKWDGIGYYLHPSKEIRNWVESIDKNLLNLSKHKKIPNKVFSLTKECIAKFISSLWSHDGSVYEKNGRLSLEYSSASEELIDGLSHLLIRFGINMRKRKKTVKQEGETFYSWSLETSQSDVVQRFLSSFELYGEKGGRSFKISEKMNRDYMTSYPKEIWPLIEEEIVKMGFESSKVRRVALGVDSNGGPRQFKKNGCCSIALLEKINAVINSPVLQALIDSDIGFVEVESIEDIGEHQCYDLTVPENENFIANDIIAHNTITTMNFLRSMCAKHNISSFNYQCEMEKEDMVKHYAKMTMLADRLEELPTVKRDENGKPVFKDINEKKRYEEAKEKLIDIVNTSRVKLPIHKLISYHPQSPSDLELDKVCQKITEVVQRFGCKVVVFDNLHFLCRGDKAKEMVEKTTQAFKMLARQLGVIFFVVTHPKKTNHNRELENDDLKESGAIFQDADAVILLHRAYKDDDDIEEGKDLESDEMLSNVMNIKVTARRHKGGRTRVIFNGATSSIIDTPKAKELD